ncbi:MAG: GntR family transcriptional regulator [Dermabacter sp.]|nr:GntR family transcriptional regulator [Dermabacter sp.]
MERPTPLHTLRLDPDSPLAASQQIHEQVARAALTGELAPGTKLPAVRVLAAELGIAPGTAAKAIKSLEAAGIVSTHGRHGTLVEAPSRALHSVQGAARHLASVARAAGMDTEEVHRMVDAALAAQVSSAHPST